MRRVRHVDGLHGAAQALGGQRQQPVVWTHQYAVLVCDSDGHRSPLGADLGIDHGEVHSGGHEGQGRPQS